MNRHVLHTTTIAASAILVLALPAASPASASATSRSGVIQAAHTTDRAAVSAGTVIADSCDDIGQAYEQQVSKWVLFCGLGYFNEPSGGWQVTEIQLDTTNRWWFHGTYNGTAYSWCTDYTHENIYTDVSIPTEYQKPANIQVVSNTAAC
jgi:hypothetical protein